MAEILGLVSSVLTVAQIAGSVGASVIRLKTQWDEVKNVPDTIKSLMLQLELLGPLLSEMEIQVPGVQTLMSTDRLAMLSLQNSRKAMQSLELLVDDLHHQISSTKRLRKSIAKVKVTLKKEMIRTYQDRLQSALQLLSLSLQTHLIALSRFQTSLLVSEFQTLSIVERQDHQTQKNLPRPDHEGLRPSVNGSQNSQTETQAFNMKILPWRNNSLMRNFRFQMAEISVSPDETDKVYQARLQLPSWPLPRAWDLQVTKSYSGWRIILRPWVIRPLDSEIFDHALRGLTKDLLQVLKSNKASVYDRNSKGWTLLHYASFEGHLGMFQKLVELGLSVHETDDSGITPLYYLCRAQSDPRKVLDIYRYLSSQKALDEVVQDVFLPDYRESRQSSLYKFVWSNSELLDLIITHYHPTFYRLPANSRFKSISWEYSDPEVLLKILKHDNIVSPTIFLAQIHGSSRSSLHEFSGRYFQHCLNCLDSNGTVTNDHDFSPWRELLKWMCTGVSVEDICRTGHDSWDHVTPLFAGLLGCEPVMPQRPSDVRNAILRLSAAIMVWLEDLLQAGMDLQTYGKQEWKLYMQDDWLRTWHWTNFASQCEEGLSNDEGPLLPLFSYGAQPSDWTFPWKFAPEKSAGDSRIMLEEESTTSILMPGGWVED